MAFTRFHFALLVALSMSAFCKADSSASPAQPSDYFPIMPWEYPTKESPDFADPHHGIASMAECGYTIASFVRPQDLPACEKLGLKAIVTLGEKLDWRKLSDDQIDAKVRAQVERAGKSPAILGYFLTDEPGIQEFPALRKAVAAVKKYAPGKLAYINLFPDYATLGAPNLSQLGTDSYSEYLEKYVQIVKPQFISYDNYRVLSSNDLKDPKKAESYYLNLLAVSNVAMKNNLPFWNIASSNEIRPNTPIPSPANFLFQAYTTLAAGAKGLTWFLYYERGYHYSPIDGAGRRTQTWTYLKMANDQVKIIGAKMIDFKSTGVYFTNPAPAASLQTLPGKLIDEVQSESPLMVGEFIDPTGQTYAMIVNLSLRDSTKCFIKFHASPKSEPQYFSPADGSLLPLAKDSTLWLTAGQGILIRLP